MGRVHCFLDSSRNLDPHGACTGISTLLYQEDMAPFATQYGLQQDNIRVEQILNTPISQPSCSLKSAQVTSDLQDHLDSHQTEEHPPKLPFAQLRKSKRVQEKSGQLHLPLHNITIVASASSTKRNPPRKFKLFRLDLRPHFNFINHHTIPSQSSRKRGELQSHPQLNNYSNIPSRRSARPKNPVPDDPELHFNANTTSSPIKPSYTSRKRGSPNRFGKVDPDRELCPKNTKHLSIPSDASRKRKRPMKSGEIYLEHQMCLKPPPAASRKIQTSGSTHVHLGFPVRSKTSHKGGSRQRKNLASIVYHKQKSHQGGPGSIQFSVGKKEANCHSAAKKRKSNEKLIMSTGVSSQALGFEEGNRGRNSRHPSVVLSREKKQSSNKKMSKDSRSPISGKGKDLKFIEENETSSGSTLLQGNARKEGNCIRSSCFYVQNERKLSYVVANQKSQAGKTKLKLNKSSSFRAKRKGDEVNQSSDKKDLASKVQVIKNSKSLANRKLFVRPIEDECYPSLPKKIIARTKRHLVAMQRDIRTSERAGVETRSISVRCKEVPNTRQDDTNIATHCRGSQRFPYFGKDICLKDMVSHSRKRRKRRRHYTCEKRDTVCPICQLGGELILCDHCPSAYHLNCINLKDVPDGKWFCPSCRCGECGTRDSDNDLQPFTSICYQCSLQYHMRCLSKRGAPSAGDYASKIFCSQKCFQIFQHLSQLLGKSNPTFVEGLSWCIVRSPKTGWSPCGTSKLNNNGELSQALKIMHECFETYIEPHTNRDLVRDIIFNRVSKLKRLDFRGFYMMILRKGDDYVSAATVRILGEKVAEMPLIATGFRYRRQGMCRLLVDELEKMLSQLGVERLLLPAIAQLKETWKQNFGFTEVCPQHKLDLLGYPILVLQGTTLCQKILTTKTEIMGNGR